MDFSEKEILRRILKVGWTTARDILEGKRAMTEYQKDLLAQYNSEVGPEYAIHPTPPS